MKFSLVCFACIFSLVLGSAAQVSSPEAAVEDLLAAGKRDTLLQHLPANVQGAVSRMSADERSDFLDEVMPILAQQQKKEGLTLHRRDGADVWDLLDKDGRINATITFEGVFIKGREALLPFRVWSEINATYQNFLRVSSEDPGSRTVIVKMCLEQDEWRIVDSGEWSLHDLEAELKEKEDERMSEAESKDVTRLKQIASALETYQQTYLDAGLPSGLQVLSGTGDQKASELHARLLPSSFLNSPILIDGYEFKYVMMSPGSSTDDGEYEVTASPVEWGKSGSRSFFMNQDGEIHFTRENRDADESDGVLIAPETGVMAAY